ncbi:nucleopolyhedrovirus P10 family protein [Streptomyces sp. NPDC002851]
MTADRWTDELRDRLGLGRLLPLGGPTDGAWLAERAAATALTSAAAAVRGVRPGAVRLSLADPAATTEPGVPPPPGALPPGPLRIEAAFAATATPATPFPHTADRLRTALAGTADHLGLLVEAVDLRVTELLDEEPEPVDVPPGEDHPPPPHATTETTADATTDGGSDEARAAAAALAVPGVTRLSGVLSGIPGSGRPGRAVHVERRERRAAHPDAALAAPHVRVELAVAADHRAVTVALAVRQAVADAFRTERPTVAVVVTAVD